MAWVRIHDGALSHPKVVGIFDPRRPFDLWLWGLSYTQTHLTDGHLPSEAIPRGVSKATGVLIARGLWEPFERGFRIHDYLDWNDSKEYVTSVRQLAKARMALVKDPEMRRRLRERDQDICRYCGVEVNWADRKSRGGATYDHVTPGGGDTFENLVIACRGCNSQKQKRNPEQANMKLLPPPAQVSGSESRYFKPSSRLISSYVGVGSTTSSLRKETVNDLETRAGRLREELYPQWYAKYRHGAKLRLIASSLEFQDALSLVQTWDDDRLAKLAQIVLTTDEEFIAKTDRSFRIFALKASWADDRLKQAEQVGA